MTSNDRDPAVEHDLPEVDPDEEGSRSSSSGTQAGAEVEAGVETGAGKPRTGRLKIWQETGLLVVLAVVVAVVVKQLFVQAFYIPSESMEPGLQINDRILVEKPSYWFGGEPQRGDIVVFSDPGGWLGAEDVDEPGNPLTKGLAKVGLYPTGGHLVKRVIGVAGDTIVCCDKRGRISVDGHPLDELGYARPATTACGSSARGSCYGPMPNVPHWSAGPVPDGYVFVMGDNRDHSADSTYHLCTARQTDCAKNPYVPVHDVVGKVAGLVWPLGRVHWEHRPATFAGVPTP